MWSDAKFKALSSHYAGRIWKGSLFLQLGLSSIMEMQIIKNSLRIGEIWRCRLFFFMWLENILKMKVFKNDWWHHGNHVNSLTEISSKTNLQWLVSFLFLNLSSVAWMENIWCFVRVKPLFSNFCGIVYMGPKSGSIFCVLNKSQIIN